MEFRLAQPKNRVLLLVFLVCWFASSLAVMAKAERHALVIGNASYPDEALHNPINDANSMAVLLRDLNFNVVLEKDLDYRAMQRAIKDWSGKLTEDSLAVFYFAGHGTHIDQSNFLIPVTSSEHFAEQGISVDSVIQRLEASKSAARILILDACRTLPGSRGTHARLNPLLERGFASKNVPSTGTLVAYAAAPGEVASDGPPGDNGVFTAALLKQLEIPGRDVTTVIEHAVKDVYFDTDGEQNPHFESSLQGSVYLRPDSPQHCLDLLPLSGSVHMPGPQLGRVLWKRHILEPVLVWPNQEPASFQSCLQGVPTMQTAEAAELFKTALVTRFEQEDIESVTFYRHVQGLGYARSGEVNLAMRSSDHMLETRRKQDDFVEVVGSASMSIIRDRKPVLLVASRHAMVEMDLQVWDEPWGTRGEDSKIGRRIIWWQIEDSGELSVHPAVDSFAELVSRLSQPGETTQPWEETLEELAEEVFSEAAYSILIADTKSHIDLAEALQTKAEELESATLDVAKLQEPKKRDRWAKNDLERLEATASRGRFWLLGRFFDLAAILPERIAGQVRFAYLKSNEAAIDSEDKFLKEALILKADSPNFRLANALYLDQINIVSQRVDFLQCLVGNASYGADELSSVLEQGLERMGQEPATWPATTDVATAFNHLFLGLDLPDTLPLANHLFEGSIRRQSDELVTLLQSLGSSLASTPSDADGCHIALLPDSALIQATGAPLEVVLAPSPTGGAALNPDSTTAAAQEAKDAVRRILRDLIHVKGARHTREQMMRGYRAFDRGNALLRELEHGEDAVALQEAIEQLTRAREIFNRAYEDAFRAEHTKPRVRVH